MVTIIRTRNNRIERQQPRNNREHGLIRGNPNEIPGFTAQVDSMIVNQFATLLGRTRSFNNMKENKNIDKECGYPASMSATDYKAWFTREPLAQRVVTVYPEETWAMDPDIYEKSDPELNTDFEVIVAKIFKRFNLFAQMEKLDIISGIGRFGLMLFGYDDGQTLDKPIPEIVAGIDRFPTLKVKKKRNLTYVRVFDETRVSILEYERDVSSPRYGQPLYYQLQLGSVDDNVNGPVGIPSSSVPMEVVRVHWSRTHHLADNTIDNPMLGLPRMEVCTNRIFDVRKVAGGSAEMFWQGAFPGISFEANPNMTSELTETDQKSIRNEMDRYSRGLSRYLAIVGVTAKSLAPQVADPTHHVNVQLLLISMAIRTPLKILLGSEESRLASSQDMLTWNKRLFRRQQKHVDPNIVIPITNILMMAGVLPYVEDWTSAWPDLNTPTESDRADMAMKMSSAIVQYVTSGGVALVPPLHFLTIVLGFSIETAKACIKETGMDTKKLLAYVKELNLKQTKGVGGSNTKQTNVGGT